MLTFVLGKMKAKYQSPMYLVKDNKNFYKLQGENSEIGFANFSLLRSVRELPSTSSFPNACRGSEGQRAEAQELGTESKSHVDGRNAST